MSVKTIFYGNDLSREHKQFLTDYCRSLYRNYIKKTRKITVYFSQSLGETSYGELCTSSNVNEAIIRINIQRGDIKLENMLVTVTHEFIHVKQLFDGRFVFDHTNALYRFDGKVYTPHYPYLERPWEIEAYANQNNVTINILEKMAS